MKKLYLHLAQRSTLADAKTRLNIHDLWRHFGFDGEPKTSCRSPFRRDNNPSFSVNAEGTLWHDFTTDEGGDAVDFFRRATGLSQKDACRKFVELAGGHFPPSPPPPRPQRAIAKPKPIFPDFNMGRAADLQQLADLRNLSNEGLELARERDLLRFATIKDCPAWIVTDAARWNAQARRLDGLPWEHLEAHPKAYTLPGSAAAWPIGIASAQPFPIIALCEGGPDFLAAHYLALWEQGTETRRDVQCSPVAMLGASLRIHADALPLFAGKHVRIFGHDDEPGRASVELWAGQLATVGAEVDAFTFSGLHRWDGKPVNDLNDALLMDPTSFAQSERIMP